MVTRPASVAALLPEYRQSSPRRERWVVLALYLLSIFALITALPSDLLDPRSSTFLLIIGPIAAWRYAWATLHLIRGQIYLRWVYPRWRRQAERVAQAPPHIYFVMTSYKVAENVATPVFVALLDEIRRFGVPATVAISVGSDREKEVVENLLRLISPPDGVGIILMVQDGTGKRAAMGEALRALNRRNPVPGSVVCLMDGDTVLDEGVLRKSLRFFSWNPNVGAVTTDNIALTKGSGLVRDWFDLRMAQRHQYMSSIGLSKRTLVLTGRCSFFRGAIVFRREFIDTLVSDHIDHWRYGRIPMLTGDDKTTWFMVLKDGWDIVYAADARIFSLEELPKGDFPSASIKLMVRWFGNMLRNNSRASALPLRNTKPFLKWCLIDQQLSIWTSLTGPVAALLGSIAFTPTLSLVYVLWILVSRLYHTLIIYLFTGRYSPYYVGLLYYNQVVGAAVKVYVMFRLNRQRWTRQGIAQGTGERGAFWPIYLNWLAIMGFVLGIAVLMGIVKPALPF